MAKDIPPQVEQYEARTQTAAAFGAGHGISYAQPIYGRATYHQSAASECCAFVEVSRPVASAWAQVKGTPPGAMRVCFFAGVSALRWAQS